MNEQRQQQWIAQRRKTVEDRRAEAAETLKDHVYTALVDQPDLKAWRCKAPGTTAYAFDIMMSRFGIAVVGDIDNLTFEVGLGYGIEFLAKDDIDYYVHSKLSPRCKEREFDEPAFHDALVKGVRRQIAESTDDEFYDELPEWIREDDDSQSMSARWLELRQFICSKLQRLTRRDEGFDTWNELNDLLNLASHVSYAEEAREFMSDHHEVLGLGDDPGEICIEKTRESLIRRLHLINHAARAIIAQQQQAEQSQAVAP